MYVILIVEGSGKNISCYQCNSGSQYDGGACGDPVDKQVLNQFLKPCDSEYSLCRKMTQNGTFLQRVFLEVLYEILSTSNQSFEECDS